MSRIKQNDNGPVPGVPVQDKQWHDLQPTLTEETEDAQLRDAQKAKSEGMCEAYTRAPWRQGGWD